MSTLEMIQLLPGNDMLQEPIPNLELSGTPNENILLWVSQSRFYVKIVLFL